MELDSLDHQILDFLRRDARTHFTKVGQDLGISDATVHVRVKKLMDEGVIERFTIVVNDEVMGKKFRGFVFVNVNPGFLKEVAEQLVKNKKIDSVNEIHGPNDLILKITANSLDEMRELMLEIREIPNVADSELVTILKIWKKGNPAISSP